MCRCRVKILPLIMFVCLLALLLRLGFWQLSRAEEKQAFLANQQENMLGQALPIGKLLADNKQLRFSKAILEGHYDVQHQILMDNQIHAGKVGYFVLTPFILEADQKVILVNRGWVLMNRELMNKGGHQLPDVNFMPPAGKLTIVGVINHFPEVGLVLEGADEPGQGWPSVVQIINSQKITKKLQQPILGFQLQLAAEQPYGYVREWQVNTRIPPEKHRAYAFQWFALAATLTLLILWISCKTQKHD